MRSLSSLCAQCSHSLKAKSGRATLRRLADHRGKDDTVIAEHRLALVVCEEADDEASDDASRDGVPEERQV